MSFTFHPGQIKIRIPLVRGAELVVTDRFVEGEFAVFGGADVVGGVHQRVADEADVGHDADEFLGGHGGPDVAVYLGVVDLELKEGGGG